MINRGILDAKIGAEKPFPGSFCPIRATFGNSSLDRLVASEDEADGQSSEAIMRQVRNPQMKLGEVRIEDIELDLKSRDDIPALLLGLQHLYADAHFRSRLFALLDEHILPGIDRTVGRPGMEMWRILVMGVIKQGLGCDFDRLHELVNEHKTLRRFLGHADVWDDHRYSYQRLVDNVGLLRPELLVEVNHLIVESGHGVAGKKPGAPLAGRCDSSTGPWRPGMEMWRILVMGVIKQGLGCDFDRLHELVNEHKTLRRFPWPCGCGRDRRALPDGCQSLVHGRAALPAPRGGPCGGEERCPWLAPVEAPDAVGAAVVPQGAGDAPCV